MVTKLNNKEAIFLSKTITTLLIICLVPIEFLKFAYIGLKDAFNLLFKHDPLGLIALFPLIIALAIIFYQIYLIMRLIYPKTSKHIFTNYTKSFHPFFIISYENEHEEIDFFFIFYLFIGFIILIIIFSYYQNTSKNHLFFETFGLFCGEIIIKKIENFNKLPINYLKNNRIRMLIKYEDYINYKIADGKPHIEVNQFLEVIKKEYPRTSVEKETIEIRNFQTSGSPALVTKFNDSRLVKAIDEGHELKVRIFDIKEYGEIEIEMWLENINSQNC